MSRHKITYGLWGDPKTRELDLQEIEREELAEISRAMLGDGGADWLELWVWSEALDNWEILI